MKLIVTLFLVFGLFQSHGQCKYLSNEEMLEDINIYVDSLKKRHIGLYRYNTKKEFKVYVDSLSESLPDSLTTKVFFKTISLINARIRCGHSKVQSHELEKDTNNYFPFTIKRANNKFFISHDFTIPNRKLVNQEINSINGIPISSIIAEIKTYIKADGFIKTEKAQRSEVLFPLHYAKYYETDSIYRVVLNNKDTLNIKALGKEQLYKQLSSTTDNLYNNDSIKNIQLVINEEKQYFYLKVNSFHVDTTIFKSKLDSVITQINNIKHQPNLIIDLRANVGGKVVNENYLLSYLVSKKISSHLKRRYLSSKGNLYRYNPDFIVSHKNNYKGNVYFLIDGFVFSAASEFSAIAKYYNLGKFIGEETGGAEEGCNYGKKQIELPNSKIKCRIPQHSCIFKKTTSSKGRGVFPDYEVKPEDALDFAIKLLTKN